MNYSLLENFSGIEGGVQKQRKPSSNDREENHEEGLQKQLSGGEFIEATQKFLQLKTFQKKV